MLQTFDNPPHLRQKIFIQDSRVCWFQDAESARQAKAKGAYLVWFRFSPKHVLGNASLANLAALALSVKPIKFQI
jgi:hypothetical protein